MVGWLVIGSLNERTQSNTDAEVLETAMAVAKYSNSLASTGSVESNAAMTREGVIETRGAIANYKSELEGQLAALEGMGYDDRAARIRDQVGLLVANVDQIENGRPDLLRALPAGEQNRQKLALATNRELAPAAITSLDNQFHFMMTGRSDLRDRVATGAEAFSKEEFLRYTHISTLLRSLGVAHSSLIGASRMVDPTLVTTVEEAFDSAAHRMERSIEYLSENGGPELDPSVVPLSNQLIAAGTGPGNYFGALRARLSLAVRERELIAVNGQILAELQLELDGLVAEVQQSSAASKDESAQKASTGRIIVLVVGIVGVVLALLSAGYFAIRGRQV